MIYQILLASEYKKPNETLINSVLSSGKMNGFSHQLMPQINEGTLFTKNEGIKEFTMLIGMKRIEYVENNCSYNLDNYDFSILKDRYKIMVEKRKDFYKGNEDIDLLGVIFLLNLDLSNEEYEKYKRKFILKEGLVNAVSSINYVENLLNYNIEYQLQKDRNIINLKIDINNRYKQNGKDDLDEIINSLKNWLDKNYILEYLDIK